MKFIIFTVVKATAFRDYLRECRDYTEYEVEGMTYLYSYDTKQVVYHTDCLTAESKAHIDGFLKGVEFCDDVSYDTEFLVVGDEEEITYDLVASTIDEWREMVDDVDSGMFDLLEDNDK